LGGRPRRRRAGDAALHADHQCGVGAA
jgi:hypothetical protein